MANYSFQKKNKKNKKDALIRGCPFRGSPIPGSPIGGSSNHEADLSSGKLMRLQKIIPKRCIKDENSRIMTEYKHLIQIYQSKVQQKCDKN